MRRLLILTCLFGLLGCDDQTLDVCGPALSVARTITKPVVDPPVTSRFQNWTNLRGQGSCVYASAATILATEGRPDLAKIVSSRHSGPADANSFAAAMRADGLALRQDDQGGMAFVDRCMNQGRPCGARVGVVKDGDHFIVVVHSDCYEVGFVDPNRVNEIEYVDREAFAAELNRAGNPFLPAAVVATYSAINRRCQASMTAPIMAPIASTPTIGKRSFARTSDQCIPSSVNE